MIVCHSCKRRVVACSTGGTSAGLGDAEGGSWLSNGNMEKAWETPGAKGVRETWIWKNDTKDDGYPIIYRVLIIPGG